MPRSIATVVILCVALLPATLGRASLIDALSVEDLTARSTLIIQGATVASDSHYDERGRIVTDVTLRIGETWKGTVTRGDLITLRTLGGSVGDLAMTVPGEPVLVVGQELVLFARPSATENLWRPVGMSQGTVPLRRLADGSVEGILGGQGLSRVVRDRAGNWTPAEVPAPMPLDELRDRVRTALRKEAREP
ncbi:MAG: hypothetical protein KC416_08915 [Myxococcales bacterium]|nr:hypothetical protein [Myxococcales bacterium]